MTREPWIWTLGTVGVVLLITAIGLLVEHLLTKREAARRKAWLEENG